MAPLIPIAILAGGALLLLIKGSKVGVFPSAAIIPEIQGQPVPKPTEYTKGTMPASYPAGGKAIPLDVPFMLYPFSFSKGTSTIYGYWVAVAKDDPNSWVSFGGANNVSQRTVIASHGDQNKVAKIAYFMNLSLTG